MLAKNYNIDQEKIMSDAEFRLPVPITGPINNKFKNPGKQ